jgi:uncharacterized protein (UPF0305 family)
MLMEDMNGAEFSRVMWTSIYTWPNSALMKSMDAIFLETTFTILREKIEGLTQSNINNKEDEVTLSELIDDVDNKVEEKVIQPP